VEFHVAATPNTNQGLQMPRACPVEYHVCCYLAENVNAPRDKPVASSELVQDWVKQQSP
jgi:hypothetical protein